MGGGGGWPVLRVSHPLLGREQVVAWVQGRGSSPVGERRVELNFWVLRANATDLKPLPLLILMCFWIKKGCTQKQLCNLGEQLHATGMNTEACTLVHTRVCTRVHRQPGQKVALQQQEAHLLPDMT